MLARACENEAENAKRMRMGMEPISQPLPVPLTYSAPMDMIAGLPAGVVTTGTAPGAATAAIAAGTTLPGGGIVTGGSNGSPLTLTVTMDKTKMEYKPEQLATLLSTAAAAAAAAGNGTVTTGGGGPGGATPGGIVPVSINGCSPSPLLNPVLNPAVGGGVNTTGIGGAGTTTVQYRLQPQPPTSQQQLQQQTLHLSPSPLSAAGLQPPPGVLTAAASGPQPPQSLTVYTQQPQPLPQQPQPPTIINSNGIGLVPTVNGQMDTTTVGGGGIAVKKAPLGAATGGGGAAPLLNHKLNGTEMAAVRQLITGYRESAAFLLRSADELEHLIQIQQKI